MDGQQAAAEAPARPWETTAERGLTGDDFRRLLDNRIPVIRATDFVSPEECRALSAVMRETEWDGRYGFAKDAGYVGVVQVEFRDRPKRDYFDRVAAARERRDAIFRRAGFDPLQRLIDRLREATGGTVRIATDAEFGEMYCCIIRSTKVPGGGQNLHADFAANGYARDYEIGDIDAQLAWNLFFEMPERGGETIVFNRPWSDTRYVYPLPPEHVENAERVAYEPRPGDLILFNSRNPHDVRPSFGEGLRLAVSSFIGRLPNGDIVLWS